MDLGLLQMEIEGRPDGEKPYGCESVLAHVEKLLEEYRRRHGDDDGFAIDEKQCELIRAESLQYYYRYLSMFVLEEYGSVAADTARNIRVLDFCAQYAEEEPDRYIMEQYRPYILMMNTRASTRLLLGDNRPRAARRAVEDGLTQMRRCFDRFGQEDLYGSSSEVASLQSLLREVEGKIPPDPAQKLRQELSKAVEEERYEEAARLRDAIGRSGVKAEGDA